MSMSGTATPALRKIKGNLGYRRAAPRRRSTHPGRRSAIAFASYNGPSAAGAEYRLDGVLPMIFSLTVILLCQLVGEVVVRGAGLPVPGPVLGMLLLAILFLRDRLRAVAAEADGALEATGKGLLAHLSLLFVPAGVGVIQRLDVFASYGVALSVSLVLSTIAALLATVATFVLAARWFGVGGAEP
jgi:holin-like protein